MTVSNELLGASALTVIGCLMAVHAHAEAARPDSRNILIYISRGFAIALLGSGIARISRLRPKAFAFVLAMSELVASAYAP